MTAAAGTPAVSGGARSMGPVEEALDERRAERDPARPWAPSPFTRLARTHGLSVAGDAIFTAAMAGTVFFSANSLDEARGRVALTLLFTIAPFAVAAPLIGPLVDRARGGRRWMIILIAGLRALVCLALIQHYDTWALYPEGLLMLVLSKGYLIARGAIVPTVVRNDAALVKANARLTLLSGIAAAVAILPAGLLLRLGGPGWALGLAAAVFVACTVVAFDLPKTTVAPEPVGDEERAELRSIGILVAASSMGLLRGIVGFLAFLIAFYAKDNDVAWLLGVGAVFGQGGFLLGSVIAPVARRSLVEERILTACLVAVLVAALPGALLVGDDSSLRLAAGIGLLSLVVGCSSNVAKQAFDAIVQRDAPDANRGRSFARFETRFQLVWVVGAMLPTALPIPLPAAYVFVAGVAAFALVSYLLGRRRVAMGLDHRLIRVRRRPAAPGGGDDVPPPPIAEADDAEALPDDDADRTLVLAGPTSGGTDAAHPTHTRTARAPGGEGAGILGLADVPMPDELHAPPPSALFDPSHRPPPPPPASRLDPSALPRPSSDPGAGAPSSAAWAEPAPASPPPAWAEPGPPALPGVGPVGVPASVTGGDPGPDPATVPQVPGAHGGDDPAGAGPPGIFDGEASLIEDHVPSATSAPAPVPGAAADPASEAEADGGAFVPDLAGEVLADRQPRWRDEATPHLPGFEPDATDRCADDEGAASP